MLEFKPREINLKKFHLNLFILQIGVEESIVNIPLQNKNTNNAKSEVRFKQLIRDPVIRGAFTIDSLRIHLNEHPI
jgi:hypothetical protein